MSACVRALFIIIIVIISISSETASCVLYRKGIIILFVIYLIDPQMIIFLSELVYLLMYFVHAFLLL